MATAFCEATLYEKLRYARITLSGALAGAAVVGAVSLAFGLQDKEMYDLLGALGGVAAVTIAKLLHFA